jgi:hypothetical protein
MDVMRFRGIVRTSQASDDITFFARVTNDEGMNYVFGPILVYNRAITEAENAQIFNRYRGRYGI